MRGLACTHHTFQTLSNILGKQVLRQPPKTWMCIQTILVCTHSRGSTLRFHTCEASSAKYWTNPLEQENTLKLNIIAYIKPPLIQSHISVRIDREGGSQGLDCSYHVWTDVSVSRVVIWGISTQSIHKHVVLFFFGDKYFSIGC